eukprot:COSAG06_NODE_8870_length_2045_cov_2.035971_2_plen_48_part_00
MIRYIGRFRLDARCRAAGHVVSGAVKSVATVIQFHDRGLILESRVPF